MRMRHDGPGTAVAPKGDHCYWLFWNFEWVEPAMKILVMDEDGVTVAGDGPFDPALLMKVIGGAIGE